MVIADDIPAGPKLKNPILIFVLLTTKSTPPENPDK